MIKICVRIITPEIVHVLDHKINRTIKALFYFQGTLALYTQSSAKPKETSKYQAGSAHTLGYMLRGNMKRKQVAVFLVWHARFCENVLLGGPNFISATYCIRFSWVEFVLWSRDMSHGVHSSCQLSPLQQIIMPHTASCAATRVLWVHTKRLVPASRTRNMFWTACRPLFYQKKKTTSEVTTNQKRTTTKFIFQNVQFVTALPLSRLPLA